MCFYKQKVKFKQKKKSLVKTPRSPLLERLLDLSEEDLHFAPFAAEVLRRRGEALKSCAERVRQTLIQKLGESGCFFFVSSVFVGIL